jgi:PKD domain
MKTKLRDIMQLFKYLNQRLHILFAVSAVFLFFSNQADAVTISSNSIIAKPNQQVTFTTVVQVTVNSADTLTVDINYGDGTPDVEIYDTDPLSPNTVVIKSNHTYSRPGTYNVRVSASVGGAITIVGPTSATMVQTIDSLDINRIQLYFDNNRPETTLKRNQKAPKLYVKINYSGSGYFKGYWEIDGVRKAYVFKNLSKGPSITLKYPAIPPLPTYRFGTHKVRFVVTNPAMHINFPYGVYFVTSDEAPAKPIEIKLLQPLGGESLAYNPLTFKWQPVGKSSIYLLSVFSKKKEERIFSAYTRQGEYELQPSTLKLYMQPGEDYLWNVTGYNDENEIISESIPSSFSFNQETAFIPEQEGQGSD